jgi:hypothetical protein
MPGIWDESGWQKRVKQKCGFQTAGVLLPAAAKKWLVFMASSP